MSPVGGPDRGHRGQKASDVSILPSRPRPRLRSGRIRGPVAEPMQGGGYPANLSQGRRKRLKPALRRHASQSRSGAGGTAASPSQAESPRAKNPWRPPPCAVARRTWGIKLGQFVPATGPAGTASPTKTWTAFIARKRIRRRPACGRQVLTLVKRTAIDEVKRDRHAPQAIAKTDAGRPNGASPTSPISKRVDMTELEELRVHLNASQTLRSAQADHAAFHHARPGAGACRNTRRSTPGSTMRRGWCIATPAVHIGIATQTAGRPDGAGGEATPRALDVWDGALPRSSRVAADRPLRAKDRSRGFVKGSTITVTSAGAAGGRRHDPGDQPSGSRHHRP